VKLRQAFQAAPIQRHSGRDWPASFAKYKRWDEMENAIQAAWPLPKRDKHSSVASFNGASVW